MTVVHAWYHPAFFDPTAPSEAREGVLGGLDAAARRLSLITPTSNPATGQNEFALHIPGTSPDRTAHSVIYPVAAQLSLVTPKHDAGGDYFALKFPLLSRPPSYDPQTGVITPGETAGETTQRIVVETAQTAGDAVDALDLDKVLGDVLDRAMPLLVVAGVGLLAFAAISKDKGVKHG